MTTREQVVADLEAARDRDRIHVARFYDADEPAVLLIERTWQLAIDAARGVTP